MFIDVLVTIFRDVIFLMSIFTLSQIIILFTECFLALLPNNNELKEQNKLIRPRMAILVPAHNEETVIVRTLKALLPQLTHQDRLIVIADNCNDKTAELSRKLGVTVIERNDSLNLGKGYALDYGLRYIQLNPPQIVAIVDADCIVQPDAIDQIALEVMRTKQPVQAVYLMEQPATSNPHNLLSALAFKIKNLVRPQGLYQLNLPCLLTGTGMAFPWSVISQVSLDSSNLVEDMQLSIDLALAGKPPRFCPQAQVRGILPQKEQSAHSQKKRWTHGHLKTIFSQCPRLLKQSVVQRRWDLLAIALDLFVLPLSLLVMIWLIAMTGGLVIGILQGEWRIPILSTISGVLLFISLIGAWIKFARNDAPLKTLLTIPWYLFRKQLPVYLAFIFNRQQQWVKTERDEIAEPIFSLSSQVSAAPEQISAEIASGAIIFHTQSGSYFSLNEIGTFIWRLIQEPQSITDIRDTIIQEYSVTPEVCLRDLLTILEQLAKKELIEISNESIA
ncbi:PqqD family peptide modification chaperone [Pleurocapsa sp. PCC 7319]|uniref:PqqD family peptide modification chaperone n=1 Tax=Pleurocapsa sp. PCC 7319 TaxID=118161 RepID=UPI00034CBBA4|nr:PqqD family peptide modification chaperone [Pleurocapsa sp. PCC 7319]